jgi:hypothetical protein
MGLAGSTLRMIGVVTEIRIAAATSTGRGIALFSVVEAHDRIQRFVA